MVFAAENFEAKPWLPKFPALKRFYLFRKINLMINHYILGMSYRLAKNTQWRKKYQTK